MMEDLTTILNIHIETMEEIPLEKTLYSDPKRPRALKIKNSPRFKEREEP